MKWFMLFAVAVSCSAILFYLYEQRWGYMACWVLYLAIYASWFVEQATIRKQVGGK